MSRCTCCNAIMPPSTTYRDVQIKHPTVEDMITTIQIEEDFCPNCLPETNLTPYEEVCYLGEVALQDTSEYRL